MFSSTYLAMLNLVFITKLVLSLAYYAKLGKLNYFLASQILREINFGEWDDFNILLTKMNLISYKI